MDSLQTNPLHRYHYEGVSTQGAKSRDIHREKTSPQTTFASPNAGDTELFGANPCQLQRAILCRYKVSTVPGLTCPGPGSPRRRRYTAPSPPTRMRRTC